jgi:ubiquinone/menaquinone biosynthesis C-methylase UbiE
MAHLRNAHTNMPGIVSHPARYDWLTRPLFARLHTRIAADVAAAELPDGSRLLDAGTGPGRVPITIAATQPRLRVDGVDLSPEMIQHAKQQAVDAGVAGQVTFTVGDVTNLPFQITPSI